MKTLLIITTTFCVLCFSCMINKSISLRMLNKTIEMAVFTSNNYALPVYESTTAGLAITVKKSSERKNIVVLEKTFPSMPLQYFPDAVNAFKDSLKIANVQQDETLEICYTLTYDSNGSVMQVQGDEVINGAEQNGKLSINI